MDLGFVKWIGHASFLMSSNGKNIYIDPFNLAKTCDHADAIFITHPHFDHFSERDIKMVADDSTKIFIPKDSVDKVQVGKGVGVEPNMHYSLGGIEFDTVPAYNIKSSRLHFHPKDNGWVGYVININGTKVYHAGDTDFIKEIPRIHTDLALLPMGGTYVMDVDEMISASRAIKADKVAPMHYKALLGNGGSGLAEKKFLASVENGILLKEIEEAKYSFQ